MDVSVHGMRFTFHRGFVVAITCTAEDWLRHADALYWHPGQGRPCPATAQPLERVTLTTPWFDRASEPDSPFAGGTYTVDDAEPTYHFPRWPGVEFRDTHGPVGGPVLRESYSTWQLLSHLRSRR